MLIELYKTIYQYKLNIKISPANNNKFKSYQNIPINNYTFFNGFINYHKFVIMTRLVILKTKIMNYYLRLLFLRKKNTT